MAGFIRLMIVYVAVFAAMMTAAVLYRFSEERLGLVWRSWLTTRVTTRYLDRLNYLRLRSRPKSTTRIGHRRTPPIIHDNYSVIYAHLSECDPGGRVVLGVLWTISPLLFGIAVGYAAFGTLMTILLGRPLVWLNYAQSGLEADYRATLIHVRENAEWVALLRREGRLSQRLLGRIDELVQNFRRITSVNRNLAFFTTGYNYLIQIIPMIVVAPQFIRGNVEFGAITQSAVAFTQLLGAFSLIVTQFGALSSFAAVVARLAGFAEVLEAMDVDRPAIETVERW